MKKPKTVKICTRVTEAQSQILEDLAITCGLKSTYGLLKYLVFVYIRASRQGVDSIDATMPADVVKMFTGAQDYDSRMLAQAMDNIRTREKWKRDKQRQRHPERQPQPTIHDEIEDMFEEYAIEGGQREWKPDINKRM